MCDFITAMCEGQPACEGCEGTVAVLADGEQWLAAGPYSIPVAAASDPLLVVAALISNGLKPVLTPDGRLRIHDPAGDELAQRRDQRAAAA